MNGQQGPDQGAPGGPESHLSYLLNSAGGQGGLMGYHGALGGMQRLGYGVGDASLEEQILQRASALRAEVLMQQQQQQQQQHAHQRQHNLGAALAALQQQQQQHMSSFTGLNPAHFAALSPQEQEALIGRAAALRELGISGGPGGTLAGVGMERLQQLELGRLEELERRRQQLAALAGFSGAATAPPRPNETNSSEKLGPDSTKSDTPRAEKPVPVGSAEKSKEELRKTPGTVIVPCRARGMPMDHNFKTAYFVISEDAKHGEDLVCSYFACRNGGVKFRYCAHCMAPVAKRNFCRRHDHGMSDKLPPKEDEEDESMEESDSNNGKSAKTGKSSSSIKKPEKNVSASQPSSLDVLSKAASSTTSPKMKVLEQETQPQAKPQPQIKQAMIEPTLDDQAKMTVEQGDDYDDDDSELAHISKKRRKMWSALLIKRPRTKDPRQLSSWLNEVLTVSDFEMPFEQNEAEEAKTMNVTSSKKPKGEKELDASSSKKEKKAVVEKKKRKSDKMTPSDKPDNSKPKKEKIESKPKEKKIKSPIKEKPAVQDAAPKIKSVSPPKEEVKKDQEIELPKDQQDKVEEQDKKNDDPIESKVEKEVPKSEHSTVIENGDKTNSLKAEEAKPREGSSDSENSMKTPPTEPPSEASTKEDDGFAGSFADWRDRKKEKLLKKGPGSLKK